MNTRRSFLMAAAFGAVAASCCSIAWAGSWRRVSTRTTRAYNARQGNDIYLPSGRPLKLRLVHRSGVRRTLGVWGKDSRGRDVILFNGVYADGQEIVIPPGYRNVHMAVNFTVDNPPKYKRWMIQGRWHRQAYHAASVDVDIFQYR